jgi:DNA-binding transcriptional LysR family regulator
VDLRLLQIFCRVYEERSFSKAAEGLRLAQPTVSEHVKALETLLETPLFDRTHRTVRPTRAGEYLYEQARGIDVMQRRIFEGMSRFLGNLAGQVSVGATTIPGEVLLPRLIAGFREKNPRVRVSVAIRSTRGVLDDLASARLDIGFVGARMEAAHFEFSRIASDRLVLLVPKTPRWKGVRSITLQQLRGEPLIVRERGSGTRAALERCLAEAGVTLEEMQVVAELGSTTAIKEGVKERLGVAIVSNLAIHPEVATGLLRDVIVREMRSFRRDFHAVRDVRRKLSPSCEGFLEHVRMHSTAAARR